MERGHKVKVYHIAYVVGFTWNNLPVPHRFHTNYTFPIGFPFGAEILILVLIPASIQVKVSNLDGKVLGLYFSANWYPPCRNFNQIPVRTYEKLQDNGLNFEVVYVSSNEDSDAFNEYRASMPWPAIPFSDLETKITLNRKFGIEGIPCLIILQPRESKDERATLHEGVEVVYRYGVDAFPFTKEGLEQMKEEYRETEENQTLVALLTNNYRDYLLAHPFPKQVSSNYPETYDCQFL